MSSFSFCVSNTGNGFGFGERRKKVRITTAGNHYIQKCPKMGSLLVFLVCETVPINSKLLALYKL